VNTFDRHVIRRFVTGYVFFVGALILFFVVLHYVEYMDDFFDRGATLSEVFLVYYPSYVPKIVRLTSPLALFLACIYLTGKLAQELQIAALQTSGVSLYRLMRPYVVVAVLTTSFMFWFNGWIVPVTNATVLKFDQKYLKDAPQRVDISDIHRQNAPRSIVTVGYYDDDARTGHRVSLQRFENARRLAARVDARRMEWIDSLGQWRLHEAVRRQFADSGLAVRRKIAQVDTTLNLFPRDLARTQRDVESMTLPVASEYVGHLRRSGADELGRPLVAYFTKFSYPFANLIVVLLGVPLAAARRRGGQAVRIGIGLGVAFLYLALMKLTEPFGYAGTWPPWLVAWLPHAVFALVAAVLLWQARK
jgi:lipopolysaccharide export system permease protein